MKHGVYDGKVADATMGRSRTGKLYVELLLENQQGETCSWLGYMASDENVRITMEQLKFLGLQDGQGPEALIGKDVKWKVGERTSQDGKVFEDVKLITYTGLRTPKTERITGQAAAELLFPKPYQPKPAAAAFMRSQREREPGEDELPF